MERLFVEQKIMVLVCTSTLAWGVNFPAHLVVIKGTEFYDGKQKRYVDFPVTDVLQMMGRAGRPQFDQQGIACILVHEPRKSFYRKFLYEPFPVESCLQSQLHDHFNAEVVSGTIRSLQDGVDFLTWTYFYRRLTRNPGYYHLEDNSTKALRASCRTLWRRRRRPSERGMRSTVPSHPPSHAHAQEEKGWPRRKALLSTGPRFPSRPWAVGSGGFRQAGRLARAIHCHPTNSTATAP